MYKTTLSQTFSPCGNYLAAGDDYGDIVVFDIQNALKEGKETGKKSICKFTSAHSDQVCSMASTENFLITGTVGEITGWSWPSVIDAKPRMSWSISIPTKKNSDRIEPTDVNSLRVYESGHSTHLIAGCGDNSIYMFDLEDGKTVRTFEAHKDYLHSVYTLGDRLVSAGEDGNVFFWDLRQKNYTGVLTPHKEERVTRPFMGKWIADVSMTDDWMVCGGGPRLSLWHLRSMDLMLVFNEVRDNGIHICRFQQESLLAGGRAPFFYHLSYTGDVLSKLDTSSSTIFTAAYTSSPKEVLSLGGSSSYLDICTNFKFRHQVLTFQ